MAGWLRRLRGWLNSLGNYGGKRMSYRTHTDDGQPILIEPSETILGNNEATAFFRDLCGAPLKEVMLRQGLTNIPLTTPVGEVQLATPVEQGTSRAMAIFRRYGIRVSDAGTTPIFAKPGTYPYVELQGSNVPELPEEGRPVVIRSEATDRRRPPHAIVVFTVFDVKRRNLQKQVTVHFHGRGIIRAKGFSRELGVASRAIHYDGEEVRQLLRQKVPKWANKIYWCTPTERF